MGTDLGKPFGPIHECGYNEVRCKPTSEQFHGCFGDGLCHPHDMEKALDFPLPLNSKRGLTCRYALNWCRKQPIGRSAVHCGIYVSRLENAAATRLSHVIGWSLLTHYGVLLRFAQDGGGLLQLERNWDGIVFKRLEEDEASSLGVGLLVSDWEHKVDFMALADFIEKQASSAYNVLSKQCKHFAFDLCNQVLGLSHESFPAFCGQNDLRFMDWEHHPIAPLILQVEDRSESFPVLPVTFHHECGSAIHWVGAEGRLMELHVGDHNQWQWHLRHTDQGVAAQNQPMAVAGDGVGKRVFWISGGQLHELMTETPEGIAVQHFVHEPESIVDGSHLVAGGGEGTGVFLFWAGNDERLHSMHQKAGEKEWRFDSHHAPGLQPGQPLAFICDDHARSVLYLGSDSRLHELKSRSWKSSEWQLSSRRVPDANATVPLAAGGHDGRWSLFYAGTCSRIHELQKGDHNDWEWEHIEHKVPHVLEGQPLAFHFDGLEQRVFWSDDDGGQLWQMHWNHGSWSAKSLYWGWVEGNYDFIESI